ncbi:hypothetical protein Nepgr_017436 [Nepenthes gracilis]|uniref:Uncharacterized protein n=1 Tax=Nepenthes gracilis TaxID=150966 RepID=A0AAD3SRF8_NEPGR|nr:hypothetical protein Nepgr_017436 [Nepenthes gracilis]
MLGPVLKFLVAVILFWAQRPLGGLKIPLAIMLKLVETRILLLPVSVADVGRVQNPVAAMKGWRLGSIPADAAISELEWQCIFAVFPLFLGCTVRVFLHVGVVDAVSLVLLFAAAGLGLGLAVLGTCLSEILPAEPVRSAGGVAFWPCACRAPFLKLNPVLILSFEELVGV